MKPKWIPLIVAAIAGFGTHASASIEDDVRSASVALRPALERAEAMIVDGRLDDANDTLAAVFPEQTRTAVQSLVLGNILFRQDPKRAYALHQKAAAELPEQANAQLEWAMEQHRAREYAGAAAAYAKFTQSNPDFAPAWGMLAECLVRTGKLAQASAAWQRSEQAPRGSLTELETWICEVNARVHPDRQRADLIPRVKAGDIAAAEALIRLDSNFPRDWWNTVTMTKYLDRDLEMIKQIRFEDARLLKEIICAGECAQLVSDEQGAAREKLIKRLRDDGYLFDDASTLPRSGSSLATMLGLALKREAITVEDARRRWGEAILASAKASKDAELYNVAARLYVGTDQLAAIDEEAWAATGDERFAASLLVSRLAAGTLKLEDADLQKAAADFPENAMIAGLVVDLTAQTSKPLQPALVKAIQAEYSHLSTDRGVVQRASARRLRGYFVALARTLAGN
jgi:hypothetical protein